MLQVADALDDKHVHAWEDMIACRVMQHASADDGNRDDALQDVFESLSNLPQPCKQRVFSQAARNDPRHTPWRGPTLRQLLAFLPSRLHPTVLETLITPDKQLTLRLDDHSLPLVEALAGLSVAPPSVLSLSTEDHDQTNSDSPDNMTRKSWRQAASALAEAMHHHTGLTSLRLSVHCIDGPSVCLLSPALAALSSIQCFQLHSTASTATLAVLRQTFAAWPHLQSLHLVLTHWHDVEAYKRPRDMLSQQAEACGVAAMLAAATTLTALYLRTDLPGDACFLARQQIPLPALCELTFSTVGMCPNLTCQSLLERLRAPLTSLDISLDHLLCGAPGGASSYHALLSRLAHFTLLQSLALRRSQQAGGLYQTVDVRPTCDAIAECVPLTLAALPQLHHVTVAADYDVLELALPLLADGAQALSSLSLEVHAQKFTFRDGRASVKQLSWRRALAALTRSCLAGLHQLDLHLGQCHDVTGLPSLEALTQLTGLHVRSWGCVQSSADLRAVTCMPHLQQLHLTRFTVRHGEVQDCILCLAALSSLTSLVFASDCGAQGGQMAEALAAHAPEGSWPALQHLTLPLPPFCERVDAVSRFVCALPALSRFSYQIVKIDGQEQSTEERAGVHQHFLAFVGAAAPGLELVALNILHHS